MPKSLHHWCAEESNRSKYLPDGVPYHTPYLTVMLVPYLLHLCTYEALMRIICDRENDVTHDCPRHIFHEKQNTDALAFSMQTSAFAGRLAGSHAFGVSRDSKRLPQNRRCISCVIVNSKNEIFSCFIRFAGTGDFIPQPTSSPTKESSIEDKSASCHSTTHYNKEGDQRPLRTKRRQRIRRVSLANMALSKLERCSGR